MTWDDILKPIKNTDYYKVLWKNVEREYAQFSCFPPKEQIFRALELTDLKDVKVVILGQDPYHNDHQANGLSFSVSDQVKAPASLRNIFKELQLDLGIVKSTNELDSWAKQGVLMLNATLSVRAHSPNSHKDLGWEKLTDELIKAVSLHNSDVVFVLWGAFAQKKEVLIDQHKHFVIKSPHPSPFSAHKGFFGSQPFSKINNYLQSVNKETILW